MDSETKQALDGVDGAIQRAKSDNVSRQPRFDPEQTYYATLRWLQDATLDEPEYVADSRKRDGWLRRFWRAESHLAGVVNSVVAIDKNRSWTLIGGRNQVNRYNAILRDAENGQGWRHFTSQQALAYYTADIGAISEIGRDGEGGPLRALYTVDQVRCKLTGNVAYPLEYKPARGLGKAQKWKQDEFFRCVSLPDSDEELLGLGYCAVSRCLELAKLMVAVYQHDQEKLGARAPKGLLLLKGIAQKQWEAAMEVRTASLNNAEQEYFGAVAILASTGPDEIDAKLVALSQLPDGFDLKTFTDLLMYGYALAFGYDPIEFWPVAAGALGRGRETEIQHRKATGKGGMEFALALQDQLQRELPDTLSFEFEQRDASGEMLDAAVAKAWADVADVLYQKGEGILDREQVKSLLAERGVIPPEWTALEEDSVATAEDDRTDRQRLLESPQVQRSILRYPNEPIVRYRWPQNRIETLWERGVEAIPRSWQVEGQAKGKKERQKAVRRAEGDDILFEEGEVVITEDDVTRAIQTGRERMGEDYASLLDNEPILEGEGG